MKESIYSQFQPFSPIRDGGALISNNPNGREGLLMGFDGYKHIPLTTIESLIPSFANRAFWIAPGRFSIYEQLGYVLENNPHLTDRANPFVIEVRRELSEQAEALARSGKLKPGLVDKLYFEVSPVAQLLERLLFTAAEFDGRIDPSMALTIYNPTRPIMTTAEDWIAMSVGSVCARLMSKIDRLKPMPLPSLWKAPDILIELYYQCADSDNQIQLSKLRNYLQRKLIDDEAAFGIVEVNNAVYPDNSLLEIFCIVPSIDTHTCRWN